MTDILVIAAIMIMTATTVLAMPSVLFEDGMVKCQETHSMETCFNNLNN
jgi:hypothetical protein